MFPDRLYEGGKMQRIVIFQQGGNGEPKVKALRERGRDLTISRIYTLDVSLPPVIDEPSSLLPPEIDADLVLSFLGHPDLVHDLAVLCERHSVPMVASGRRIPLKSAITPPT